MLASPSSYARPFVIGAALLFLVIPASASRVAASANDISDVNVTNTPNVRLTEISDGVLQNLRRAQLTPSFLRANRRYAFIWNPGDAAQVYVVVSIKDDGWIGVVVSDSPQPEFVTVADPRDILWLNVTRAFSIREIY